MAGAEKYMKSRKLKLSAMDKVIGVLNAEIGKENPDLHFIEAKMLMLEDVEKSINDLSSKIWDVLVDSDLLDPVYDQELTVLDDFKSKIASIKVAVHHVMVPVPVAESRQAPSEVGSCSGNQGRYRLPKIEIKKFSGEYTDWLSWWTQFQKIHENGDLDPSDKFQYLVQSIQSGTRAHSIVSSYPITDKNYAEVIQVLKKRFGNKTILVEIYVRKLLKMVVASAQAKEKKNLSSLYDQLESNLRALKTLGVETDNSAAFLYPLVESSLPEEVVQVWQRCGSYSSESGGPEVDESWLKLRLTKLMEFLEREVENSERLEYVKKGFEDPSNSSKRNGTKIANRSEESLPTASTLFSGTKDDSEKKRNQCVFCEKNHWSAMCKEGQKMTDQERRAKLRERRACFSCFKFGHVSQTCAAKIKCSKCGGKHYDLVCKGKETEVPRVLTGLSCSKNVLLQTLMVNIVKNGEKVAVRAALDTCSECTYILDITGKALELAHDPEEITIEHEVFGGGKYFEKHKQYHFQVENPDGTFGMKMEALGTDKVCSSLPRMPKGPWTSELSKNHIWISDLENEYDSEIKLLIGADYYGHLITGKKLELNNGLVALDTKFGWSLMGKRNGTKSSTVVSMLSIGSRSIQDLWSLDVLGIKDPIEVKSQEEKSRAAQVHFEENLTRDEDGRYGVSLPWNNGVNVLPSNRKIAQQRLLNATAKLQKSGLYNDYDKIFKDWISEGIIEVVPEDDKLDCFYLPHRPVIKETSTTTPVRPVFDASCKSARTPSLNECLFKGPNLLELIPNVLLQFREKKIGVTSDIRKAFQMIEVHEADRDYLRFLWWNIPGKEFIIFRHKRVPFGVNASPFLLGAVINNHLSHVGGDDKDTADKLKKSLYVDNCTTSVSTMAEYEEFKSKSIQIMADGMFELRQWEHSLSPKSTPRGGCGLEKVVFDCLIENKPTSSVLGLLWEKEKDTLSLDLEEVTLPNKITKRTILSQVGKVFDPIGFSIPALVPAKVKIQKLWAEKLDWDQELSDGDKHWFWKWTSGLEVLRKLEIPRCMTVGSYLFPQLHMFCDASQDAYAAVVYLRTGEPGNVRVQLLQAKSRVAPMKKCTIPRLELLGCTIGARLASGIESALGVEGVQMVFWTDSSTALAWIQKNDDWGTFVGNRVKEICKLTQVGKWRHVPGELNPADLPSRGCTPQELLSSKWWEGPSWLYETIECWPNHQVKYDYDEIYLEKKKSSVSMLQKDNINLVRFSSFLKNIRLVAWMLRFKNNCLKGSKIRGPLTLEEIQHAELTIWKMVQKSEFRKVGEVVNGIRVVLRDGLVLVKTKLIHREDTDGFRFPILLPEKHPMVHQLIQYMHEKNCHGGVQFLMSKLRERFWIFKARQTIKKIVNRCVKCRRFAAKPVSTVPVALPMDRVMETKAFGITGVDLAGPLYLKGKTKVWIVLFTCAVYRAVHLEIVKTLTTDDFVLALIRFFSRRGRSSKIYSDNGTNFVGTNNLFGSIDWAKVEEEAKVKQIQWIFSPPTAAWWGGFWERLIRCIKDLLKRMLGNEKLKYVELETCLCEVEAVVNARPLTYVSEDPDDLIPLTPAMFVQDSSETKMVELEHITAVDLRKKFGKLVQLRKELRERFRREYLGILVQKSKDMTTESVKPGDVVLVTSDNKKRIECPLARVDEVIVGKDGVVRVAWIQTADGGRALRPVQRLVLLEVQEPVAVPQEKLFKSMEMLSKSRGNAVMRMECGDVSEDLIGSFME